MTKQHDSLKALMRNRWLAIALLLTVLVLIAIEGTWNVKLHDTWGFVAVTVALMVALGFVAAGDMKQRRWAAAVSHLGMFVMLLGGLAGAPLVEDSQLVVTYEKPETYAYSAKGGLAELPFGVQLKDFTIDYYDDGVSPKQYTSTLLIGGEEMQTSVNRPCHYMGYSLYQMDYDMMYESYSVLKVVRDPLLPVVLVGMMLLVAGAMLDLRKAWHSKAVLPVVAVLTIVFGLISVARISFGTLMPALRSMWFVPHLIIYMIAYSLLAIALVMGIASLLSKRVHSETPRRLLVTASSLLLIGMLCGAVWANQAWGQYWSWDAKENWAAVTWLLTVVGMHLPHKTTRPWAVVMAIALAFAAMQITWYGVNYLPSASSSLHTYNR